MCPLHAHCRWKKEFHELQSKYLPYQEQIDQLVGRIQGLQSQSDLAESEVRLDVLCVGGSGVRVCAACDQGPMALPLPAGTADGATVCTTCRPHKSQAKDSIRTETHQWKSFLEEGTVKFATCPALCTHVHMYVCRQHLDTVYVSDVLLCVFRKWCTFGRKRWGWRRSWECWRMRCPDWGRTGSLWPLAIASSLMCVSTENHSSLWKYCFVVFSTDYTFTVFHHCIGTIIQCTSDLHVVKVPSQPAAS